MTDVNHKNFATRPNHGECLYEANRTISRCFLNSLALFASLALIV